MDAPQIVIQTRSAPTEVNEDVARVGWSPDHAANEDVLGRKAGDIVAPEDRLPIVTEWSGMTDWVNCPPSYDVWADQYYSYTRTMLFRWGVRVSEVEDMAHDIMARFQERDSLGVFTPNWGSKSESGKSNFRSYYSRFLFTYSKGKQRNNIKHYKRNLCIFDSPMDNEETVTWGEVNAGVVSDDDISMVEFGELISQLRAQDGLDNDLIDAVLILAQDGPVRQKALAETLYKGDTRKASSGLRAMREALLSLIG